MFVCVFFDCKCKSFKRQGENTTTNRKKQKTKDNNSKKNRNKRTTGYPALDPTANKYISGSGWEIYVFLFFVLCFF